MLLYLDNCCFNRPFDNREQAKVRLETEAKLHIQDEILLGKVDAERSIIREPFDYTEWQRDLFHNLSVRELSNFAMKNYTE